MITAGFSFSTNQKGPTARFLPRIFPTTKRTRTRTRTRTTANRCLTAKRTGSGAVFHPILGYKTISLSTDLRMRTGDSRTYTEFRRNQVSPKKNVDCSVDGQSLDSNDIVVLRCAVVRSGCLPSMMRTIALVGFLWLASSASSPYSS